LKSWSSNVALNLKGLRVDSLNM